MRLASSSRLSTRSFVQVAPLGQLVRIQSADRVLVDVSAPHGERKDAPKRGQHSLARPGRETRVAFLAQERRDHTRRDLLHLSPPERREHVMVKVLAVSLQRA